MGRLRDGDQAWPTDEQWESLRAADKLAQIEPDRIATADEHGVLKVGFELPMPSISQLTLVRVE